jgi:hypothetical protein
MDVGFVQLIQGVRMEAQYSDGSWLESSLDQAIDGAASPVIDTAQGTAGSQVWYTNTDSKEPITNNPNLLVGGAQGEIAMQDSPFSKIPAYSNLQAFEPAAHLAQTGDASLSLQRAVLQVNFETCICAEIKPLLVTDPQQYNVLAMTTWSWDGTGTVGAGFAWNPDVPAGVAAPDPWQMQQSASTIDLTAQRSPAIASSATWNPESI